MKKADLLKAWGRILLGYYPSLSVEIARECPLRCPGCYAYEREHLGELGPLRSLADQNGEKTYEVSDAIGKRRARMMRRDF